jgi:hypothetical protein
MELIAKTYLSLKYFDPDQDDMDEIFDGLRDYLRNSDMTKEKALELLEKSGEYYDVLPEKFQTDVDIALKATELDLVPYMNHFRNDPNIADFMYAHNCSDMFLRKTDLVKDKEWVLKFFKMIRGNNRSIISLINCKNTFIDKEILAKAKAYLDLRITVPLCNYFKEDREVALRMFSYNKYISLSLTPLKDDEDFVKDLLNLKNTTLYIEDIIMNCVMTDEIKDLIKNKWQNSYRINEMFIKYKI